MRDPQETITLKNGLPSDWQLWDEEDRADWFFVQALSYRAGIDRKMTEEEQVSLFQAFQQMKSNNSFEVFG